MTKTWDDIYRTTDTGERSWTQPVPLVSLQLIDEAATTPDDAVVDVGAGASRLVDELLVRGFTDITVLDLAASALDEARERTSSDSVTWICADVLTFEPRRSFQLWHDRAVFHFLVDDEDRHAYVAQVGRFVNPGGHLIIGTFALDGPETCSGRPVRRYDAASLSALFSDHFELVTTYRDEHHTPWESVQPFTWVLLRRRGA